jgi:nucleoside phosphorylase
MSPAVRGAEPTSSATASAGETTTVPSDRPPVDFVIVTALEEERDAILGKLPGYQRLDPFNDDIRVYFSSNLPATFPDGSTGTYHIVVMPLLDMGRTQATAATGDAIHRWNPRYVILVGISGGVAENDVKLGDVLVSTQIVDYELQKLTSERTEIRWEVYRADPRLVGAARNLDDSSWLELMSANRPGRGAPKRYIGPIASGDKVIAASEALAHYRDKWPKLIGVEMEAAGVAIASSQAAQQPGFFMVRGVSDLADKKKNSARVKRWRSYACDIAASYVIALLKSGPALPSSISDRQLVNDQKPAGLEENQDTELPRALGESAEDTYLRQRTQKYSQGKPSSLREVQETKGKIRDYFISYNEADRLWAEWIAWQLEESGYTTIIQVWDFLPGSNFVIDMQRAAVQAERTIAVLSSNYLDADYTQPEWSAAFKQDPTGEKGILVPVRVRKCNLTGMLSQIICIDLVGLTEADAKEALLAGLGRRRAKPITPPSFPGKIQHATSTQPHFPGGSSSDIDDVFPQPLPDATQEIPNGAVVSNKFYIERKVDTALKRHIVKFGTTVTIRGSRQTGKTSLLVRGVHYARQRGAKAVHLDLQGFDRDRLTSLDVFLREMAESIVYELQLDVMEVSKFWRSSLGPKRKLTYLIEEYILPKFNVPIILALDEADRLLETHFYRDFFSLTRSWHNRRAVNTQWRKFNLLMVISSEPYILIDDANQSPFNVGLMLYLEDFNEAQVCDLNQRYGSPLKEGALPQLMALLNGHPYLTRQALYTLADAQLTWTDLIKVAVTDQGPFDSHLRHLYWLLHRDQGMKETLKQIIHHSTYTDEIALLRLLRAGIVKRRNNGYTCRCSLYQSYFEDRL